MAAKQIQKISMRLCIRWLPLLFLWACSYSLAAEPHGTTPLMEAAYHGDLTTVQQLVAAGTDVNQKNELGVTALWMAAGATPTFDPMRADSKSLDAHIKLMAKQTRVVRYLLEHGADPNQAAINGATPLMQAVRNFNVESVKALIAHGADVNARGTHGQTALLDAVGYGFSDIVTVLLDHGAQVNGVFDPNGLTPLMLAIQQAHFGIAETLIKRGADVNERGHNGQTALSLAVKKNRPELVRMLEQAGAKE
jgi:ankyrin repeat protein